MLQPGDSNSTVPGAIVSERPAGTTTLFVTRILPISGPQVVCASTAPPTEVELRSNTMSLLVEYKDRLPASRTWISKRLNPGDKVVVEDHVPTELSDDASTPSTTTRLAFVTE